MKYKDQIQNRTEAVNNLLETLERGIQANAMSKVEVVNLIAKLKRLVNEIDSFTDLEA
jgi:ABC-type transporter Mla subunit MlaD